MRYFGREFTGKGVKVAIIDSGVNPNDPRLAGVNIEGWHLELSATNHAAIGGDWHDKNGHGTDIAAAILELAPDAEIWAVRIMDERLRTSADLMAAGIETAYRNGAHVINLSLGTKDMGKALLLRDACHLATEANAVVLAAAHPKGDRAYPADLPETIGVATHRDCPLEKFYYYAPHRFPRRDWGHLSGKFLTHGHEREGDAKGAFKGPGIATAYVTGRVACLREALPQETSPKLIERMQQLSLTPVPEIGYA